MTPSSSDLDIDKTIEELDSVRNLVLNNGEDFEKIAKDFSDDKMSAPSGGFFLDNSGSTKIAVDQLDPTVYFTLDTLKVGSITNPIHFYICMLDFISSFSWSPRVRIVQIGHQSLMQSNCSQTNPAHLTICMQEFISSCCCLPRGQDHTNRNSIVDAVQLRLDKSNTC